MICIRILLSLLTALAGVLVLAACDAGGQSMITRAEPSVQAADESAGDETGGSMLPPVPAKEGKGHAIQPEILQVPGTARAGTGRMQQAAIEIIRPALHRERILLSVSPNRESYGDLDENPVHRVARKPVSTFGIDVDTGSYTRVRAMLNGGRLPPENAVRVEEFINYFNYDYPVPHAAEQPFSVLTSVAPTPWNRHTHLLRIGIQGWLPAADLPPANLVFLIDVSGSMAPRARLPLLKSALELLVGQLDADDRVSIVTYAGAAELALKPTRGDQRDTILAAIDDLQAGGSTNGGAGIQKAYRMARQAYIEGGINRVILATDGDFNVGTTDFDALIDLVKQERETGVALTTLGFGVGNYNAHLIEQLADRGDGNYAYIDSLSEAQRVLVTNRAAALRTIAKDVKLQLEFNPAMVAEYRLIGYVNRRLTRADFNNDKVDAGEIGAGHEVTALYEIALAHGDGQRMDPLRYRDDPAPVDESGELGFLRLRYKLPDEQDSRLMENPIMLADKAATLAETGSDFRFASAVAAFGQLLRGGIYTNDYGYQDVLTLAREARGNDPDGRRGEFLRLVELAAGLDDRSASRKP